MGNLEQLCLYSLQEALIFEGENPSIPIWSGVEMEWFDFVITQGEGELLTLVETITVFSPQLHQIITTRAIPKMSPEPKSLISKIGFHRRQRRDFGLPNWLMLDAPLGGVLGIDINTQRDILSGMPDTLPLTVQSVAVRPLLNSPHTNENEPDFDGGFVPLVVELLQSQGISVDRESFLKNSQAYERLLRGVEWKETG